MADNTGIRVDRTLTLGVVMAIAVQTAGALLWAGGADARLKTLEATARETPLISLRLARLEEQVTMARKSLHRIETRLDSRVKP